MDQTSQVYERSYQTSCLSFNLASLSLGSGLGGDPELFKDVSTPSFQRVPGAPTELTEADKALVDQHPIMKSLFLEKVAAAGGDNRNRIQGKIWNNRQVLSEQVLEKRRAEFFALIDAQAAKGVPIPPVAIDGSKISLTEEAIGTIQSKWLQNGKSISTELFVNLLVANLTGKRAHETMTRLYQLGFIDDFNSRKVRPHMELKIYEPLSDIRKKVCETLPGHCCNYANLALERDTELVPVSHVRFHNHRQRPADPALSRQAPRSWTFQQKASVPGMSYNG